MISHRNFSTDDLRELSTDPAHLFMQLYDLLPEDVFLHGDAMEWLADPDARRRAARIGDEVLAHGLADHQLLAGIAAENHGWLGARGIFVLLRGLDDALWYVNPFNPIIDRGGLDWLSTRYLTTGRLNDDQQIPGALLPRCAFPGEPRGRGHKADHFAVHRVPPEYLRAKLNYARVGNENDPCFLPEQEVKIACAPFLRDFAELRITYGHNNGVAKYRLAPMDAAEINGRGIRERMACVLRKMDRAGAQIGVLPEGCLSKDMLETWRDVATGTASKDSSVTPLRWLILGSGPVDGGDPPHNRAVLIDRRLGDTLLIHDKLERFTLDQEQVRTWKLPPPPAALPLLEDISCGSKLSVLESSLGRLAILICQDLTAVSGWEREGASIGLSHLFVPVFSKPIRRYRWEHNAAADLANHHGTWVVVSNSLTVANAMAAPPRARWYTCLVLGPNNASREFYALKEQFGRATNAHELAFTTKARRRVLPTVHAAAVRAAWFTWAEKPADASGRSTPPQASRYDSASE
ncbi:hypothetical protein [Nucisporomicrobium flavum]|uniref:hypothetical protein n=1 Tax=Nucisporomicrobium flavum TaxID=2785915 RepID=UPI0018F617DA|nr:hypothetical protein [Nucisporomicrobium flavum]